MSDSRLPAPRAEDAEIRLELTNAEGRQVWALYPAGSRVERPEPPAADLLRLLPELARRHRRLLALGTLAGLAFGIAYLLLADGIYVVKTLVHVELRKSVIRDYDARPGSSYVATQAEVIQSPAMVADAIRAIGIPQPEEGGWLSSVRGWVGRLNPFGSSEEEVDRLANAVLATLPALQATPVVGTDVMTITLRTDDPERGVRFLDALIDSYRRYARENEAAAHREGLDLLRQREAALAAQIAEAAQRYEEREAELRSLGGSEENALIVQRLSLEEHARAWVDAQRRRIDLENELQALREGEDARVAPSPEILEELERAEAALAELRLTVSPRHPDVRQMEQRVSGLRAQVNHGTRTRIAELGRAVRAARRTEEQLAGLYEREWEKVKGLQAERASAQKLGDELARLEGERKGVLALMGEKELNVLAAQGGENSGTLVRVLQPPTVPPTPVWPLPIPVLVACSGVALVGGLAFALLLHWRERSQPAAEPPRYEEASSRVQRRVQELCSPPGGPEGRAPGMQITERR
jgi:uncharacterized protein involved in exopolysaccharide biosynthesis